LACWKDNTTHFFWLLLLCLRLASLCSQHRLTPLQQRQRLRSQHGLTPLLVAELAAQQAAELFGQLLAPLYVKLYPQLAAGTKPSGTRNRKRNSRLQKIVHVELCGFI
jgi:hypothetical protein